MLVTGKNGIGVKEMPHVTSHATPMYAMILSLNIISPPLRATLPFQLTNFFAFAICFAPHRKRTQKRNLEEGEKSVWRRLIYFRLTPRCPITAIQYPI